MKIIKALAALVLTILILWGLDTAMYPCTYIRNDMHSILTEKADDIILGTSHGKINIDPEAMESVSGRKGHNMANGNEYPMDSYYIVKLMCEKGMAPGRVIYVTTPEYFTMEKTEGNNYLLFYHEMPMSVTKLDCFLKKVAGHDLRMTLFPWYEYPLTTEMPMIGSNLRKKMTGDYSVEDLRSSTQEYHENGFIERYPVDPKTFRMTNEFHFQTEDILEENLEWIRKLISLCKEEGIVFTAVSSPLPRQELERDPEGYSKAHQYFQTFYEEQDVSYLDFNAEPLLDAFTHKIGAYTDFDGHLRGDAARDFSRVLADLLEKGNSGDAPVTAG